MAFVRSKLYIDSDFGHQLKDFRTQYKVKAKDVAVYMGKSAAYISKLEKGEIHHIDREEFVKMTNYISQSEKGYELFCERIIGTMDYEDLDQSTLVNNFDWNERTLPVPDGYCEYVQRKISELNIEILELANYINKNDDLDEEFIREQNIDLISVEKNVWIPYKEADSNNIIRNYIVVEISEQEIKDIIRKEVKKATYLYLYVILYHVFKWQEAKKQLVLNDSVRTNIKRKTTNKLNEFKIYTLSDKTKALSQAHNETEAVQVLNAFDIKNQELVRKLLTGIYYLSEQDVEYANEKLEGIIKNLERTPSFSLAYMALPLEKILDAPYNVKREFLDSVIELIEKCSKIGGSDLQKF